MPKYRFTATITQKTQYEVTFDAEDDSEASNFAHCEWNPDDWGSFVMRQETETVDWDESEPIRLEN